MLAPLAYDAVASALAFALAYNIATGRIWASGFMPEAHMRPVAML